MKTEQTTEQQHDSLFDANLWTALTLTLIRVFVHKASYDCHGDNAQVKPQ